MSIPMTWPMSASQLNLTRLRAGDLALWRLRAAGLRVLGIPRNFDAGAP